MNTEWVRRYCLSLPRATETLQWGHDLVFKIGGKMFAVMNLEPFPPWLSFKCSAEDFAELTERPGIIPAPYLARAH
jgi:predicted DNA-binding protein (MmcQ/YjbR family)